MVYVVSSISIERNALIVSGKEAYVWERISHRALTDVPIQAISRPFALEVLRCAQDDKLLGYHPERSEEPLVDLWVINTYTCVQKRANHVQYRQCPWLDNDETL